MWRGRGRASEEVVLSPCDRLILEDLIRRLETMTDVIVRLTSAVASVGNSISTVADAIKNHPAAASDDGALNSLADSLEAGAAKLKSIADEVNGTDPVVPPQPVDPGAQPPSGEPATS